MAVLDALQDRPQSLCQLSLAVAAFPQQTAIPAPSFEQFLQSCKSDKLNVWGDYSVCESAAAYALRHDTVSFFLVMCCSARSALVQPWTV
eukprot:364171-Chlamydomonas_euryale.AAC.4